MKKQATIMVILFLVATIGVVMIVNAIMSGEWWRIIATVLGITLVVYFLIKVLNSLPAD